MAIGATALSVAVMVLAAAFVTGFQSAIREKLFSFWGHVQVSLYAANSNDLLAPEPVVYDPSLVAAASKLKGVQQVAPYALRPVIVRAKGQMEGLQMKGINPSFRFSKGIEWQGRAVHFDDTDYSKEVILSQTTANRLNLKPGDDLQLYFLKPGALVPRIRKVTLVGIYHTGLEEVDKTFGICDMRLLQHLSGWEKNQITGYQIDLNDPERLNAVADVLHNQVVAPPLYTYTLPERYPQVFDWLQLQNTNVQVLLTIMAIIAIINLSAALLILMVDRARIVGLLKALGMTATALSTIFISLAGLIGVVGILVGNIIGLGVCLLQQVFGFLQLSEETYYVRTVPVRIIWWHIALIDVATLLVCLVCMWLPALYIRRIQPARVLQFK